MLTLHEGNDSDHGKDGSEITYPLPGYVILGQVSCTTASPGASPD